MRRRAKARLVGEILVTYFLTRWRMRRGALPTVVAGLRDVDATAVGPPLSPAQRLRLGRAVMRTLARLPSDSRCLVRSLVLLRLLARRGVAAVLVIAARPGDPDRLDAHAWVEVEGQPVLPPAAADYGRLVTL